MVSGHRRVYLKDLKDYKMQSMDERNKALDDLAKQAQELNMGY